MFGGDRLRGATSLVAWISIAADPASATTPAGASTAGVSLVVEASCLVRTAPLVFGPHKGRGRMSISTIWIKCTKSTPYIVGLNAGGGEGATVTGRKLTGATGSVTYSVFSDPERAMNWGETIGADTTFGIGDGGAQALNVYGQIMTDESVESDNYFDTITVTITY